MSELDDIYPSDVLTDFELECLLLESYITDEEGNERHLNLKDYSREVRQPARLNRRKP